MIKCIFVGLEFVLIMLVTVVLLVQPPGWTKERHAAKASPVQIAAQGL